MLGGKDWDQRLVDYVAEEFIRKFGIDPREEPNVHGRLWRECEDAKRTLSARQKVTIACDYRGNAVRIEVTRQQFEDMTRDLLDRTSFTTRQTLSAAGLEWSDIDRVLLVGGSSRMPQVVEMLRQLASKEPDCSVSPDEAVAQGAALHAGLILAYHEGKSPTFRIRNVNSHSLGVVATDPATKRQRNAILISRNTPLPVSAKRIFKTHKPGQKSILVQIVEGESLSPEDCSQLGKCSVRQLPDNLPSQTPIEVRFHYEENGRLTVNVRVEGTAKELQHEITRENSLTQEQLNSWRKYICGLEPATQPVPRVPPPEEIPADAFQPVAKSTPTKPAPPKPASAGKPAATKPQAAPTKPATLTPTRSASEGKRAISPKPDGPMSDRDLASIAFEALEEDEE